MMPNTRASRPICPQAAAKRKHREEDREVDSGETHSAKESAKEVKQLLPAGARIQLDENAGDERGVTRKVPGIVCGATPGAQDLVERQVAATGSSQGRSIDRIAERTGARNGVEKLRNLSPSLSEIMEPQREVCQVLHT